MNYLLIWDIDGTLIKPLGIGRKSLNKAFKELFSIENAFDSIEMAGRLDAIILEEVFLFHNLQQESKEKFLQRYYAILNREVKKIKTPLVCPGVIKLMESLSQKSNIYNVLGTGNIELGARIKLSKDNLNRFFPTGAFSEKERKRWQLIQKAIYTSKNYFNVDFRKENIYVIGDTPRDIKCGKELNIKTIGVATGSHSCEQLLNCGADFVFKTLENTDTFFNIFK